MNPRRVAILLTLGFTMVWALAELLVVQLHHRYSLVQVESIRFATQFVLLLLVARPRTTGQVARLWHSRRPALQVLRGLALLGLPFGFASAVYSGVSIPVALVGLWCAPLFTVALAALVLREQVQVRMWLAALAGMVAALLLIAPPGPIEPADLIMPMLSGLSLALFLVLSRTLGDESVQTGLLFVATVGLLVLLPFVAGKWVQPGIRDGLVLLVVALLGTLALWLIDLALRYGKASEVASLLYVHVLVMHWMPPLWHGQTPSWRLLLATSLMGMLVLALWWSKERQLREAMA
ncbi:EamA family transporter [Hydrogenophaga sp.]|uniref:DMT family transporter n=1 Tax=Hydrogenophaga sp. TaxID=1904254 RepID=UPI0025BAF1A0|nr:EamA family transporter [Hydrogenophaga sp.]